MLNRDSDIYKRMTMMRNAFNGNGTIPDLFKPEREGVNAIMDIFDENSSIDDHEITLILNELKIVQNSNHYNGSAWFDFKLHLNGLLSQIGYALEFGDENRITSITKDNL